LKQESFQLMSRLPLMRTVLLGAMLVTTPALGVVYMWRDSAGTAHYSNKEYDIPARYKAKAKALYPEPSDSGQKQPNNANGPATPAAPVAQLPPITSQQAKPAEELRVQPIVTSPQIKNTSLRTTSRRERKHRVSSADDE
jgi:hypothetical protein